MYTISAEATITADPAAVWAVATDVNGWAGWDPHEEQARLDGPFAVGATGWSKPRGGPATTWTVTEVVAGRRWASSCPLPGGRLEGVTTFEPLGDGRVRCAKTITATGPLVVLFRLYFGRRIRRDLVRTFAALEGEAGRRERVAA